MLVAWIALRPDFSQILEGETPVLVFEQTGIQYGLGSGSAPFWVEDNDIVQRDVVLKMQDKMQDKTQDMPQITDRQCRIFFFNPLLGAQFQVFVKSDEIFAQGLDGLSNF